MKNRISDVMLTLSCIDDQSMNGTFIIYENVQLILLIKRDPRSRRLSSSSVDSLCFVSNRMTKSSFVVTSREIYLRFLFDHV